MVDVPLYIVSQPAIERHVQVSGGTNWDLSRSAVQTPSKLMPEPVQTFVAPINNEDWTDLSNFDTPTMYKVSDNVPKSTPKYINFTRKESSLSKESIKSLISESKKQAYVVIGHAGENEGSPLTLSWARANAVAKVLRQSGHKVTEVKAFGADRQITGKSVISNLRVEVFPTAK